MIEYKLPDGRVLVVGGRIEGQTNDGIKSAIVVVVADVCHFPYKVVCIIMLA